MSALPRGRRSRSRPTTDSTEENKSNQTSTASAAHSPISVTPHSSSAFLCPPSSNYPRSEPHDVINMVDTIVVQKALDSLGAGPAAVVGVLREQSADHSSSLSELEDNLDERDEPKSKHFLLQSDREESSEAETERLEETPRKQRSDPLAAYTPSRLGNEIHANDDDEGVESPLADDGPATSVIEANDEVSPSSPLSDDPDVALGEPVDLLESAGRKRKREDIREDQENGLDGDEPARKRAGRVESEPAEKQEDDGLIEIRQPMEESPPPLDSVENEDEGIDDQPIPVKAGRGKKGKGKGKKGKGKASESNEKVNNILLDEINAEPDETGEGEAEDDDAGSPAEQLQQKRMAFDKFASLDAVFKALREELLDEQIARLDQELLQINQTPTQHPEYIAMMACINARRDEAIMKEQYLLSFKEKDLRTRFVADRQIIQSQYVQTAREAREQAAEKCYSKLYALQRDRRRWGADDKIYGYMFNPKRSEQIKQQRAYNTEVSLLSGMAKYVGFPAAPEIKTLREEEVDEDLVKMGIQLQHTQLHSYATHTHAENWRQTYPMNPSLSMDNRSLSNPFTPAGQLRQTDVHAPNGSASTIDMNSKPPSAAQAALGLAVHTEMARQESNETPLPPYLRPFVGNSPQSSSPLFASSEPATEHHHSPVPSRASAAEASTTAFSYISPSYHAPGPEPTTAAVAAAAALKNELADAARRERSLQRMRHTAVGAGPPGLFSR